MSTKVLSARASNIQSVGITSKFFNLSGYTGDDIQRATDERQLVLYTIYLEVEEEEQMTTRVCFFII